MLNSYDLQHMRDAVANLYPDTCNILEVTEVADSEGGFVNTWGTADESACRLDVTVERKEQTDGSMRSYNLFTLSMPWDAEVTDANRIEIGEYTYLVSGIDIDQSWQIEKVLRLERI